MSGTDGIGSALAARCTSCGTVFRVVPDQLRVSAGWVRCGRCAAVFNAAENLIDLESGAPRRLDLGIEISSQPPAVATATGTAAPTPSSAPAPAVAAGVDAVPAPAPVLAPAPAPNTARESEAESDPEPDPELKPAAADLAAPATAPPANQNEVDERSVETSDMGLTPAVPAAPDAPDAQDLALDTPTASTKIATEADTPLEPKPASTPATQTLPSFVRRADRAARWKQPRVRAALAVGVVLGALLLAAQVSLAYRDLAAARWPALRPLLTALCQPLACTISPPRSIQDLTVEGSALVRVENSDLYQLNVALRNRAVLDLAMPAVELSLTDSQGRLLSRRVLQASDFGVSAPTLAAGRDLAMQTTLRTALQSTDEASSAAGTEGAAIVGYTIELFYP